MSRRSRAAPSERSRQPEHAASTALPNGTLSIHSPQHAIAAKTKTLLPPLTPPDELLLIIIIEPIQ